MFSLNTEIEKWKENMIKKSGMKTNDVYELENHLFDEIGELKKTDLDEEEAFLVAKKRLGTDDAISREYSKINPFITWNHRIFWMIFGIISYQIIINASSLIEDVFLIFCKKLGLNNVLASGIGFSLGLITIVVLVFVFFNERIQNHMKNAFLMRKLSKMHTGILLALFSIIAIFASNIGSFTPFIFHKILDVHDVIKISVYKSFFGLFLRTVFPVVFVLLLYRYRRYRSNQATSI